MLNKNLIKFKRERPVICCCSGGADSTALFYAMHQSGFTIHALTVNHNLRNKAKEEADWVKENLKKLGAKEVHILNWEHEFIKSGIEEKARVARFSLIFEYAIKNGITDIFLGHHLGDLIENFFLKLGAGSLNQLSEVRRFRWNGHYFNLIRPFILLPKAEILKYIEVKKIEYVNDETNFEDTFKRNRVRKNLSSTLKKLELSEENILTAILKLQSSEEIIKKRIDEIFKTIIIFDKKFAFFKASAEALKLLSVSEARMALKKIIFYFSEKTDFRRKELELAVMKIFQNISFTIGFVEVFESKGFVYFIKERAKIKTEIKFGIWDLRFKFYNLPLNCIIKPIDFKVTKAGLPAKILRTLPAIYSLKTLEVITIPHFENYNNIYFETYDETKNSYS